VGTRTFPIAHEVSISHSSRLIVCVDVL